jgi:FixJ family two-component response regulator
VSGSPHILIVDDDADLLGSLAFALEAEALRVTTFQTAGALAASPELADANCIVIDQILPDEPGLDLLERLRAAGIWTPAMVMTTNPAPALRAKAAALGATVIEKPLLDGRLFDLVRSLARSRP